MPRIGVLTQRRTGGSRGRRPGHPCDRTLLLARLLGLQYERYAGPPQPIRAARTRAIYDTYAGTPATGTPSPSVARAGRRRRPGRPMRRHRPDWRRGWPFGRRRGRIGHLGHRLCHRRPGPGRGRPRERPDRICTVGPYNVNTLLVNKPERLARGGRRGRDQPGRWRVPQPRLTDQPAAGALRTQHLRHLAAPLTWVPTTDRPPPDRAFTNGASRSTSPKAVQACPAARPATSGCRPTPPPTG